MNTIINRPSLVILIDCWQHHKGLTDQSWYQQKINNIIEFCASDQIQAIAISTWGLGGVEKTLDSKLFATSKEFFHDTTSCEFLRNIWNSNIFSNTNNTHPDILSISEKSNQIKFLAFDPLQILYYCNAINTHIRNIYICGFEWDICVKNRPTGWIHLAALIKSNMFKNDMNILINTKCIGGGVVQGSNFTPPAICWDQLDNNIFCLNIDYEDIFK